MWRAVVFAAMCGWLLLGPGCGGTDGPPLVAKIFNSGQYAIHGFHFKPRGEMPETGWETLDWGQSVLPLRSLQPRQFVLLRDFPRKHLDGMAAFDVNGVAERRRGEVLAHWIPDGEIITIQAGWSDDGSVFGYQWGLDEFPDEVDVTPGSTGG
jgi:hypothetical protein